VIKAYSQIKVPCIVEHAGLIFSNYSSYPGGLTKPMWNILKDNFITETGAAGRKAQAKAVVAYCDGVEVKTFTGVTKGRIAAAPRGSRRFYWDTIFEPVNGRGLTYAEIVESRGIEEKVKISQSSKAMLDCLSHLLKATSPLWP
jgi:non-canonical purine NTP pyrophosphatase (RdgB/HAM1 family)